LFHIGALETSARSIGNQLGRLWRRNAICVDDHVILQVVVNAGKLD
jgi:hypothetical protein